MQKDVDISTENPKNFKFERVRVPTSKGEEFVCFDAREKKRIYVERINRDGRTHIIRVVYYHQKKPEAKINSKTNGSEGFKLFSGIRYESIRAEDGTNYCCRTFSGRRFCRIIGANDTCDGGKFLG